MPLQPLKYYLCLEVDIGDVANLDKVIAEKFQKLPIRGSIEKFSAPVL